MTIAIARSVIVRWQVAGLHYWPDAPDGPYDYLAEPHRHLFHFEVSIPVTHDSRDVEFHELLDHARGTFNGWETMGGNLNFGGRSCEDLAQLVAARVWARWPTDTAEVAVFEDGENGARLRFTERPDDQQMGAA